MVENFPRFLNDTEDRMVPVGFEQRGLSTYLHEVISERVVGSFAVDLTSRIRTVGCG